MSKADSPLPLPLRLGDDQWRRHVVALLGDVSPWKSRFHNAKRLQDDFDYWWLDLSLDDLDELWPAVSSAMEISRSDEELELLDSVLRNLGAAIDGF